MITIDDVREAHLKALKDLGQGSEVDARVAPWFDYIAKIANAFLKAGANETAVRKGLVQGFWQDFIANNEVDLSTLKFQFVTELEDTTGVTPPKSIDAIEPKRIAYIPPAPTGGVPTRPVYRPRRDVASLQLWIKRFRTPASLDAGRRMVQAAQAMGGWFTWTASGPMGLGDRPFGTPRTALYKPSTAGGNSFASWMHGTGGVPGAHSSMNCWEAVLFTAFRANLLSLARLRQIHDDATNAAKRVLRQSGFGHVLPGSRTAVTLEDLPPGRVQDAALQAYYEKISQALGVADAVRLETDPGSPLKPRPGDILFFGGRNHVALYVGREWVNTGRRPQAVFTAYSLSNYPNGFHLVDIGLLTSIGPATFRPCPFV